MPDYKRFIAYFYEYINGKKVRNAGFVKTEYRQEAWRMTVQLKGTMRGDGRWMLYGYVPDGAFRQGVLLGNLYWSNGSLIQKLQVPSGEMNHTGHRFEEIGGLWIPLEEGHCFLSNWEDETVTPERLILEEQKSAEESETKKEHDADFDASLSKKAVSAAIDAPQQEHRGIRETDFAGDTNEEDSSRPDNQAQTEAKRQTEAKAQTEAKPQREAKAQTKENGSAEEEAQTEEKEWTGEKAQTREAQGLRAQELRNRAGEPMDSAWQQLVQRCGTIPIDGFCVRNRTENSSQDDLLMQGIQICPRDVRWLQQKNCPVHCNPFVMKGFYGYHHLMLAKLGSGAYLLGVPGGAAPQEAYLAEAYGFPEYLAKPGTAQPAGYWCRRIG